MTDKEEREACEKYLLRAGYKYGWENLESAARFMVRHAVIELEQKQINLKPITSFVMTDDSGDRPYYCVMAAYKNKEDAVEALERIS